MAGEGFRLDLPGPDLSAREVGALLVRHLGLALVGSVEIVDLRIVEEPHRGSRGVDPVSADPARRVIDLSHPDQAGLVTYRSAGGSDADAPGLEGLVGLPAEVFHLHDAWSADARGIGALALADRELRGTAVLLDTGWSRHLGTPAYGGAAPYLTAEGARHLVDEGVRLVGIDSPDIDDADGGGESTVRSLLLSAGVTIVERLSNLPEVPAQGATFTAAPPAVAATGTFSVRAFATVGESH